MNRIVTLTISVLLFSCTTSEKNSSKKEMAETSSDNPQLEATAEQAKKREFQIEPIGTITNTTWINSPFENCTDTLNIRVNEGDYYSCERDLPTDIQFSIESDTLYIDQYELVSEVSAELGTEVRTKYKMIRSNDALILVGIAYKYQDQFEPVGEEYLYKEFRRIE